MAMNIKPNLNIISDNVTFKANAKVGGKMVEPSCDNTFMQGIIESLKNAKTVKEATKILLNEAENGNFEVIDGVLFKHEDYAIQNLLISYGQKHAENLKKLSKLKLSIVPEYIDSFAKEHEIFIITKVPGTKTGNLIPLNKEYNKVPTEHLQQAFKDFQRLTKAGLVDSGVINSTNKWFITPDDKKVMLPIWENLRSIQSSERKTVLGEYHKKLFRQ